MRPYYKFCPYDQAPLIMTEVEPEIIRPKCPLPACRFVDWNGPTAAVSVLIPTERRFWKAAGLPTKGVPTNGFVVIERGGDPGKGLPALPGGFIGERTNPKQQVCIEAKEETGLDVRVETFLGACLPNPDANILLLLYVARPVGGELRAGSDAKNVFIFTPGKMSELCFSSHRNICQEWFSKRRRLTGKDL